MADYYSVEEGIYTLSARDPDEAITEWLDGLSEKDLEDIPEHIEVFKWSKKQIPYPNKVFEWGMDSIINDLEENYSFEDWVGSYTPSDKIENLYKQFCIELAKDFPVTLYETDKDTIKIDLDKWIDENGYWEG